eukprot:1155994-Pelagomonas_calceolata.AAC.1
MCLDWKLGWLSPWSKGPTKARLCACSAHMLGLGQLSCCVASLHLRHTHACTYTHIFCASKCSPSQELRHREVGLQETEGHVLRENEQAADVSGKASLREKLLPHCV